MIFSFVKKIIPSSIKKYITNRILKLNNNSLKLGDNVWVLNSSFGIYNTINNNVVLNNVELGDYTYISKDSNINYTSIGKYCSFAGNVKCGLGLHPSKNFVSTHPIFFSTLKQSQITFADKNYFNEYTKTKIGNDVWVGENVIIIGGISIGDGAIIAAGAVVSKDVPPYSIVGGVPAKIIKYRFEKEEIEFLLKFKWWDLDNEIVKNNFLLFHDVKKLMKSNLFTKI